MVIFKIFLIFCYLTLQSACKDGWAPDDSQGLLACSALRIGEENPLSTFDAAVQEARQKCLSIAKAAKRVIDGFLIPLRADIYYHCYLLAREGVKKQCDQLGQRTPDEFCRFVFGLHCAASRQKVDLSQVDLENLLAISERDHMFIATDGGLCNAEYFITLMLWNKKKYLVTFPNDFSHAVPVRCMFKNWASAILVHDMGFYHMMQDVIVHGEYAEFFDIVLDGLKPLWNEALSLKRENPQYFKSVKCLLYWLLREQDYRYISEYKGDFSQDPLSKLLLRVPMDAYISLECLSMITGYVMTKDMMQETEYSSEKISALKTEAWQFLRNAEKLPAVKKAFTKIESTLKKRIQSKYPKVDLLDLQTFKLQRRYMGMFMTKSEMLQMVFDWSESQPSDVPKCASSTQDHALKMHLLAAASILQDQSFNACDHRGQRDVKSTAVLKPYKDDQVTEGTVCNSTVMFKPYRSDEATEDTVLNCEDRVVSAMTGVPLLAFDCSFKEKRNLANIIIFLTNFTASEDCEATAMQKIMRPWVEKALISPESSFLRKELFKYVEKQLCLSTNTSTDDQPCETMQDILDNAHVHIQDRYGQDLSSFTDDQPCETMQDIVDNAHVHIQDRYVQALSSFKVIKQSRSVS